jgi:predicted GNAT family acetyltransferase
MFKNLKEIQKHHNDNFNKLRISENDISITISLIVSKEKNKGFGSDLMKDIINYANENNKIIKLTPDNSFGTSILKLKKWYKSFDFVENKGRNKDYEITENMYKLSESKNIDNNDNLNISIKKSINFK